jgi:broad specificity phosphatase PhoE
VKTIVHLMRHGEVHNPQKLLYGKLPGYQLSVLGQQMSKAVATYLSEHDVTAVIASPLERAQETALPIADQFGLPVVTDPKLIESANRFEGTRVERALRDPRYWMIMWNPFRPSWGEPYARILTRMLAALAQARVSAAGHEALCVSHQLPIWTLRRALEGRRLWHDPRGRQCGLASLTFFHFEDEMLTNITYLEPAAHLGPGTGRGA